jgi:hypothetical protein
MRCDCFDSAVEFIVATFTCRTLDSQDFGFGFMQPRFDSQPQPPTSGAARAAGQLL